MKKNRNLFEIIITIAFALCISYITILGYWRVSIGLIGFLSVLLYFKSEEGLFLFWLLTFSFFATQPLLTIAEHPILTYDRVFVIILFIILIKKVIFEERKLLSLSSVEIAFIPFFVFIIFSILLKSFNPLQGFRILTDRFMIPFLFFYLARNIFIDKERFIKFINVLFIVGVYISIIGIYEHFTEYDVLPVYHVEGGYDGLYDGGGWLRVNGPYIDDDIFGVCAVLCFFIALYKYVITDRSKRLQKVLLLVAACMIALAVVYCMYRGVWLALVIGFLAWMLIRRKGVIKLAFVLLFLAIAIFTQFDRITNSITYQGRIANIATIEDRLGKHDRAMSYFYRSPIYGIGFRNYFELTGTTSQHGQIVTMLSETGILGTISYILFLGTFFYYGIKNYKRYKRENNYIEYEFSIIYIAIIIGYIVPFIGLNSGFFRSPNILFFTISGATLGSMQRKQKELKDG